MLLCALCSVLYAYMVIQTNGCSINEYITNSQIVHCESTTPGGPYHLAPVAAGAGASTTATAADSAAAAAAATAIGAPAPNATVFIAPFAHAAHVWREDGGKGALVMAVEGRDEISYPKGVPQKHCNRPDYESS